MSSEGEDISEEQSKCWMCLSVLVIEAILELGNGILGNLGVEEKIEDVGVFFR